MSTNLESALQELISRVEAAQPQIDSLSNQVDELNKQLSAKASELENERLSGTERLKALEEHLAGVKLEYNAKTKQNEESQKVIAELELQVSAKDSELEDERSAGAVRLKALEEHLAGMQEEQDTLTKRNEESQETITQLELQVSTTASKLEDERNAQIKRNDTASEETELTLLHLHQLQEELERYFQKAHSAEEIVTAQENQLIRAQTYIEKVFPTATNSISAEHVSLEVIEALPIANEVQTKALLNSYSESLERASKMLLRAIKN